MSLHEAICHEIKEILPHPDPETISLGLVKVWDYTIVVNKNMWKVGDLAVYIEPDTTVAVSRPEFTFLLSASKPKERERIKAKRLRGVWSEGLLTPAPEGFKPGDNCWAHLELERYEPPVKGHPRGGIGVDSDWGTGGTFEAWPEGVPQPPKFGLENFKKFNRIFTDGEEVVITEKIHGSNSYYFWHDGRMYCASHSGLRHKFKKKPIFEEIEIELEDGTKQPRKKLIEWQTTEEEDPNIWWQVLKQQPFIEEICKANPDWILFGEVFGQVQGGFEYGAKSSQLFFRAFNVWKKSEHKFMTAEDFLKEVSADHRVPLLYKGPYSKEVVAAHTDGKTTFPGANHIREGCVVETADHKHNPFTGRTVAKSVSNDYLLKG